MASIENTNKIILSWKQKWDNETNDFDKFICYWISLNAWYWTFFEINSTKERDYINEIKNRLINEIEYFQDEIKLAKSLTPKLRNLTRWNYEIEVNDIWTLIEFIYIVRNNLFHWNKEDTNDRDIQILNIATPILLKILNKLLWQ